MRWQTPNWKDDHIHLFQALGYAGDLSLFASRDDVTFIREINGYRSTFSVDLTSKDIVNNPYTGIDIDHFIIASNYNQKQKIWLKKLFRGILHINESKRWNASKSESHFKRGTKLTTR